MADAPNVPTEKPGDGRGVIRWAAVYEAMTGATAPGKHHEDKPGVHEDSLRAGHEPDKFDVKGIVMVPILVVITTGLAYALITGLFSAFQPGKPVADANTVPQAAEQSKLAYNQRLDVISSTDPKAEFKQPRLEFARQYEQRLYKDGTPEPEYYRSFKPMVGGNNSPEVVPQDLYPERYVELRDGQPVRALAEYGWVSQDKKVARIPVADAMKAVLASLPVAKEKAGKPTVSTVDAPKQSNGGQAAEAAPAAVKPAPAEGKH